MLRSDKVRYAAASYSLMTVAAALRNRLPCGDQWGARHHATASHIRPCRRGLLGQVRFAAGGTWTADLIRSTAYRVMRGG
jgi:hypothetical protein